MQIAKTLEPMPFAASDLDPLCLSVSLLVGTIHEWDSSMCLVEHFFLLSLDLCQVQTNNLVCFKTLKVGSYANDDSSVPNFCPVLFISI